MEKGKELERMATSIALKAIKKELRSFMKQKLSEISKDSISSQSAAVFESIQSLKPYQEAKRIGVYLSMPTSEIQTDAIVRHALESGHQVFVPYLHKAQNPTPNTPKSVMDMVDLHSLSDYESLKRNSWGIPTIQADTVEEREHILAEAARPLDMIIIPGVAFDIDPSSGFVRRLGHGKGFYDYFLHRYRENHSSHMDKPSKSPGIDVLLYGLALEEQLLEPESGTPVPVGEHDSLLHGLLVGSGKILEAPIAKGESPTKSE